MTNSRIPQSFQFFGLPAHALTMSQTLQIIDTRIEEGEFTQHCVINVAKLVSCQSDEVLAESVRSCDLVNIDGQGVVWGARILGYEVPERVAGIDLFCELLKLSAQRGYPVYLLGATPEVVTKVECQILSDYPGILVAGSHHGYFWGNEESVVSTIRASGARLLFVAISSPKKEQFIALWGERLGVDFVMGVGGSFDVIAGKVSRAPTWMQKSGLEWLYRVLQEPGRMWRRYLTTNFTYLLLLSRTWMKDRNSS